MLTIDGRTLEGGGQILRTALGLSLLTGTPFTLNHIRGGRKKSGLLRQHLTCVQASQEISGADVTGASLGSEKLVFVPPETLTIGLNRQPDDKYDFNFDIGSAGSTTLVLQTVLPALLFANKNFANKTRAIDPDNAISLSITGGTHNPFAPTYDFLQNAFVPALAKLDMLLELENPQAGFAPLGGGRLIAKVSPYLKTATSPTLDLTNRGELVSVEVIASVLNLERDICKRELKSCVASLVEAGIDADKISTSTKSLRGVGEGNIMTAIVTHKLAGSDQTYQEVFTLLGERRMSAEKVGNRLAGLVKRYVFKSDAVVDEYLTDQLLLPMALSARGTTGGQFTARTISEHTKTQAWLIEQFLPVSFTLDSVENQCKETVTKISCIC